MRKRSKVRHRNKEIVVPLEANYKTTVRMTQAFEAVGFRARGAEGNDDARSLKMAA